MRQTLSRHSAAFLLLTLGIVVTGVFVSTRIAVLDRPDAVALGLTLDLTLLLPLGFYLLIARPRGWKPITAAPFALFGLLLAEILLPPEHHRGISVLEWFVFPLELILIATILLKTRRILKSTGDPREVDPLESMQQAANSIVPHPFAARALTSELGAFYFGLLAWRRRPHVPEGAVPLSIYRRSNHGSILAVVLMVSVAEGLGAHLLVGLWSSIAAWILTGLGLYGALWFVADFRATVLRPPLIEDDRLTLRSGLRWNGRIDRSEIESWSRQKPADRECLSFSLLFEPSHWILLREEKEFRGPYGLRKKARCVGLTPDHPEILEPFLNS